MVRTVNRVVCSVPSAWPSYMKFACCHCVCLGSQSKNMHKVSQVL